ncbi:MAG: RagB/SusD family nutrient uptake outer membrane protein [Phocaeicola sp.]
MIVNRKEAKQILLTLLSGFTLLSCTGRYLDFNTNPYESTEEEMARDAYLIRSALTGMQGYVVPTTVLLNQFLETLLGGPYGGYLAESNGGFNNRFSNYNQSQDWVSKLYKDIIPNVYTNYAQLQAATKDEVYLSVGKIVKVAAVLRVTDGCGPIPYSRLGTDGDLVAPLDAQKEVYRRMFAELDESVDALLVRQTEQFTEKADKVYQGKVSQWIKLANSLKLRMALRMVYADPSWAQLQAEEAVHSSRGGVLSSNADNASIQATTNPFRVIMYEYNGGDSRIAADITAYMNGYNDPRLNKFFVESTFATADGVENGYHGIRLGTEPIPSDAAHKYANMRVESTTKLLWMSASEVAFLRAEGALRGWNMGGSAQSFYEAGVHLSFDQWGATGADRYLLDGKSKPAPYRDPLETYSYLGETSSIAVAYENEADFESNLERIITQKWIALFPLGLEAWAEFRRTGYPRLMPAVVNKNQTEVPLGTFPRRLPYPQDEYNDNGANVLDALKDLTPAADKMSSRMWWDCNPRLQ